MTPTFKDLVDFVLANKGQTTFIGYTDLRIISMLKEGLDEGTLLYNLCPLTFRINGMILAIKDVKQKILFVEENLSMTLSNLKAFTKIAKERLPDYKVEAVRHGRHVKFNTNQLYKKLL